MMKPIIYFISIFLFLSCNCNTDEEQKRITKFEEALGEQETEYLNEIIDNFDSFLAKNYKGVIKDERFKNYLTDIAIGTDVELFWIDSSDIKRYFKSNLFTKVYIEYPDTVWIAEKTVKVLYKNETIPDEYIPLDKEQNLEKLYNEVKNEPIVGVSNLSTFYDALDTVKDEDPLILEYLDFCDTAAGISPGLLADAILDYESKSNYFSKRIFVMELNDNNNYK